MTDDQTSERPVVGGKTVRETIDLLRDAPNFEIDLPKGVALGLLVGVEDALETVRHLQTRMKTKRDKVSLSMVNYHLEGPRDRLLRIVRGDAR